MERSLRERTAVVALALALVATPATAGIAAAGTADATGPAEAATGTADTVTLTVTVVDRGNNPLSDAELTANWDGGDPVTRTTAGNGKAFLTVEAGAEVTITVDHPHYVRNQPYVVDNATERAVTVDVRRKGRATVTVEDANGPVSDAIVRLFKGGPVVNERTNADGQLTTDAIERGEYTLVAFKEGYLRNTTTVDVGASTETQVGIETGSVLVAFDVTDDHFDPPRPLANATVTVEGIGTVSTLGNGEATISVPVNREFSVGVTKDGYQETTRSLSIRESGTSLNLSIRRTPSVSIETANERIVVGETVGVTVTDEYGDPVTGATVSLDGSSVGETDSQGTASVPVDSPGNHTISVTAGTLEDAVTVVGVEPAPDETPTPTPTPTPTVTTTSSSGPGLGVVAGVVALLTLSVLGIRRQR